MRCCVESLANEYTREDTEMLHRLTEWEDNGYNDSDFWVSVYDDETNAVRAVLQGSTRFAGFDGGGPDIGQPISSLAILQKALHVLAEHIYTVIRAAEYREVLEPAAIAKGSTSAHSISVSSCGRCWVRARRER